jgi:hypothetical protein
VALGVFIFIFFPIFGLNWRYQIGGVLSNIIDTLGTLSLALGGLFSLMAIVGIFSQRSPWMRNLVLGLVFLWIGCWCTGTIVNFFGFLIGEATSGGQGWH